MLNTLLITLIICHILGKTNSIIENLEGCPTDKKNIIYRNQANINRLFSELNTTKALCAQDLRPKVKHNTNLAKFNTMLIRMSTGNIKKKAEEKEKELDELAKEHDL